MGQHKKNEFKERLRHDTNIKKQQQILEQKTWTLVDNYLNTNTFENREYLCYLSAAIYLTYKELYPDLSIYIPFRIKSDQSFIKNLNKVVYWMDQKYGVNAGIKALKQLYNTGDSVCITRDHGCRNYIENSLSMNELKMYLDYVARNNFASNKHSSIEDMFEYFEHIYHSYEQY